MSKIDHSNSEIYTLTHQSGCPRPNCNHRMGREAVKSGNKVGRWKNYCPIHGAIYYDLEKKDD